MLLYKGIPAFAVSLMIVACSTDSSSGPSEPSGEKKYGRVLTKGDNASMECGVYASDNTVTIAMNVDLYIYSSSRTMNMVTTIGSESSSYVVDAEMTGVLQAQVTEDCQEATDVFEAKGGKVTCTETIVHAAMDLPGITDPVTVQKLIDQTVQEGIERCNVFYKSTKDAFVEISGEWGGDIDGVFSAEKATSCNVSLENGVLTVNVIYPEKSALAQITQSGNQFTISETYTGLDMATQSQICTNYKSDPENFNVVCSDGSYTYSIVEDESSIEDLAVYQRKVVCPALLSGEMAFEDMWSD